MPLLMACILFVGVILGLTVGVKIIAALMTGWILLLLAAAFFLQGDQIVAGILAAVVLQFGYFAGMIIQTLVEAKGDVFLRFASRLRSSRRDAPPASENDH